MTAIKILAFAGSTRTDSFNKKLIRVAAEAARNAGAEVNLIDLRDFPMPLYDGDLQNSSGIPENGQKFKKLLIEHPGILIASPEYNSAVSGVLKNAIDWASRAEAGEKALAAFDGKYASIMSASPGALGGLRGLFALRYILENIKVTVLPNQFALSKANEAFDESGKLKDAKQQGTVEGLTKSLVNVLTKLAS